MTWRERGAASCSRLWALPSRGHCQHRPRLLCASASHQLHKNSGLLPKPLAEHEERSGTPQETGWPCFPRLGTLVPLRFRGPFLPLCEYQGAHCSARIWRDGPGGSQNSSRPIQAWRGCHNLGRVLVAPPSQSSKRQRQESCSRSAAQDSGALNID